MLTTHFKQNMQAKIEGKIATARDVSSGQATAIIKALDHVVVTPGARATVARALRIKVDGDNASTAGPHGERKSQVCLLLENLLTIKHWKDFDTTDYIKQEENMVKLFERLGLNHASEHTYVAGTAIIVAARMQKTGERSVNANDAYKLLNRLKKHVRALTQRTILPHYNQVKQYPDTPEELLEKFPHIYDLVYQDMENFPDNAPGKCKLQLAELEVLKARLPARKSHISVAETISVPRFPRPSRHLALEDQEELPITFLGPHAYRNEHAQSTIRLPMAPQAITQLAAAWAAAQNQRNLPALQNGQADDTIPEKLPPQRTESIYDLAQKIQSQAAGTYEQKTPEQISELIADVKKGHKGGTTSDVDAPPEKIPKLDNGPTLEASAGGQQETPAAPPKKGGRKGPTKVKCTTSDVDAPPAKIPKLDNGPTLEASAGGQQETPAAPPKKGGRKGPTKVKKGRVSTKVQSVMKAKKEVKVKKEAGAGKSKVKELLPYPGKPTKKRAPVQFGDNIKIYTDINASLWRVQKHGDRKDIAASFKKDPVRAWTRVNEILAEMGAR